MGDFAYSKRIMSKFRGALVSSVTVIALLFTGVQAHGAAFDPDRLPRPLGDVSLQVTEPGAVLNHSSFQVSVARPDVPGQPDFTLCEEVNDDFCTTTKPELRLVGRGILPICDSSDAQDCIEGIEISLNGQTVRGQYLREAAGGIKFPAIPSLGFYKVGSPLLFDLPGVLNGGGTSTYAVAARADIAFNYQLGRFETRNLDLAVVPYSEIRSEEYRVESIGSGANNACVFIESSVCGIPEDFPEGAVVSVSMRIPSEIGGWFMGRLKNPTIEVSSLSPSNNAVTVVAEPAVVPRFAIARPQASITEEDKKFFQSSWGSFGGTSRGVWADTPEAFEVLKSYREEAKDTAAGLSTLWSVKTVRSGGGSSCLADTSKVLGIVSTNSLAYAGTSPQYQSGVLNYEVAGLHFLADGKTEALGTYDLIMRSETARCLYGFSKAPVSATVTVTGTGDLNVATTVVSEKNGWLKLAAYGFTFSEKNIQVKLTQAQSRTLTKSTSRTVTLTSKQRSEVKAVLAKSSGNTKFICTGTFVRPADRALALQRARAACNYAKSQNKNYSFFAQAKVTKAASFGGRVMVVSK